jgi:muconolactone delta-isomerase
LVAAQQARGQDKRTGLDVYEEELRVRLDEQVPMAREFGLDAGGWFNFALFDYDDAGAHKERTLRQFQLRGWASMNIQGVHRAYVRGLIAWDDWNSGDSPIFGRGDEREEEIERAWYRFDLGQMLLNQTGQEPPVAFRFGVGRDFSTIGTAFVLSLPLDKVQFELDVRDWQFMALLGKTVKGSRNIDDSERVATHQDRCFFGVQLAYRGFSRHRPFVYYLGQWDQTSPSSPDPNQSYDYTSHYVGLGSTGTILLPGLR